MTNGMELSGSFSIDPNAPWVEAHNRDVTAVLAAYEADRPIRVPLLCGEWAGQHGFYAEEAGIDYRRYYTDPDEMLRVQLEAARRRRELPIYDLVLGQAPERWGVSVDLWPVVGPGWYGCELVYRRDSVIAHRSLNLSKEACAELAMPDPRTGGILRTCLAFWRHLRDCCDGTLEFLGRPVGPVAHGVGTNGFFSLALDLRGADIMADMVEDPAFARSFLERLGSHCDALDRTWSGMAGRSLEPFAITDHGIDMLSGDFYEEFIVPVVRLVNARRHMNPPTFLHHCGRGSHLFPIVKRCFGLTHLHALTYPLVDIARVRREVGDEVWVSALIEDSIIQFGPPERIRQTVKDLMASGAKGRGRLALVVGDMLKGTPPEHRLALYESVKEFGGYG